MNEITFEFKGMCELKENELYDINGGFPWVPVLIIGGAVVLFGSALGVGVYNGYNKAENSAKPAPAPSPTAVPTPTPRP